MRLAALAPSFPHLVEEDRRRVRAILERLEERNLPSSFVLAALRSTAEVLHDLRENESHTRQALRRASVQQFIRENAGEAPGRSIPPRRENQREERERIQANVASLLRQARVARGRHEVKRSRSQLLRLDQRELRRTLGAEGDELCRQINAWLRSVTNSF